MHSSRIIVALFCILFPHAIAGQSNLNSFNSPDNIKRFADHLFCGGDYFRAADEYQKLKDLNNDTVVFKTALAYSAMGKYDEAEHVLASYHFHGGFEHYGLQETGKIKLLNEDHTGMGELYGKNEQDTVLAKQYSVSQLLNRDTPASAVLIDKSFSGRDRDEVMTFLERKNNPHYRSSTVAAVMSSILPGAGKIYAGRTGDGITAAIVNGLLIYAAFDNFRAGHDLRGWALAGLGSWFYLGNIYGSAAAVRIYNSNIDLSLKMDITAFLKQKKYFTHDYKFLCR